MKNILTMGESRSGQRVSKSPDTDWTGEPSLPVKLCVH